MPNQWKNVKSKLNSKQTAQFVVQCGPEIDAYRFSIFNIQIHFNGNMHSSAVNWLTWDDIVTIERTIWHLFIIQGGNIAIICDCCSSVQIKSILYDDKMATNVIRSQSHRPNTTSNWTTYASQMNEGDWQKKSLHFMHNFQGRNRHQIEFDTNGD